MNAVCFRKGGTSQGDQLIGEGEEFRKRHLKKGFRFPEEQKRGVPFLPGGKRHLGGGRGNLVGVCFPKKKRGKPFVLPHTWEKRGGRVSKPEHGEKARL